jgi:conjugal transfer pilus assembly protein TraB
LIGGVDASVGVAAQSNPRPVLFRIIGPAVATSFNGKLQEITRVVGCLVTGAATGDLSSEKVFVRLLKMSCSFQPGKVSEFDVKGYAAAMGKAGIRGPVVSREGNFIWLAFWSGFMEAAGGVGSGILAPPLLGTSHNGVPKLETSDILLRGAAAGINRSTNKLSEYAIARAEQYQPVVAVQGGIEVELVFYEGVDLKTRQFGGGNIPAKTVAGTSSWE